MRCAIYIQNLNKSKELVVLKGISLPLCKKYTYSIYQDRHQLKVAFSDCKKKIKTSLRPYSLLTQQDCDSNAIPVKM